MAEPSSWPGVVAGVLNKVPGEHFGAAFWVLLGVVVVIAVPFLRKLLQPALTAEEAQVSVAKGVRQAINGDLKDIKTELLKLRDEVKTNRVVADERHAGNERWLGRIEGRFQWDGHERRRE